MYSTINSLIIELDWNIIYIIHNNNKHAFSWLLVTFYSQFNYSAVYLYVLTHEEDT